ncbi:MAG: type II toxin-antitoxin system PemK/MazF family toxin [Mycobacterium sp.]
MSGGVYATKPQPAITATDSVIVIPLTKTSVDGAAVTRVAIPTKTGIAQPSFAMIDKITTVRRSTLGARIGRVSATLMAEIERSLTVIPGLAS